MRLSWQIVLFTLHRAWERVEIDVFWLLDRFVSLDGTALKVDFSGGLPVVLVARDGVMPGRIFLVARFGWVLAGQDAGHEDLFTFGPGAISTGIDGADGESVHGGTRFQITLVAGL